MLCEVRAIELPSNFTNFTNYCYAMVVVALLGKRFYPQMAQITADGGQPDRATSLRTLARPGKLVVTRPVERSEK